MTIILFAVGTGASHPVRVVTLASLVLSLFACWVRAAVQQCQGVVLLDFVIDLAGVPFFTFSRVSTERCIHRRLLNGSFW